jgi:hypothetical protein
MKLTANYSSNYPKVKKDKSTGQTVLDAQGKPVVYTVFVYTVTGDAESLADYRASQGDNYRTSESGEPLFFATTPAATDICAMRKNIGGANAGKWGLDSGEFRKHKAIVEAAGGNLGQAIANSLVAIYVAPAASSAMEKLKAMPATSETDDLGEN